MDDAANPIESIFAEAVRQPDLDTRTAYLARACGDDSKLRARVDALLRAHDKAGAFMATSNQQTEEAPTTGRHGVNTDLQGVIASPRANFESDNPLAEKAGSTIGRYKLLQQIGEGGFGVVYMAEQEHPVKRRVALKVIKAGMDTAAVIARFEAERQALAMMDHPNIARVLDAGATDTGRPYFVMELVKGIPITEYCDQANLAMRPRLELFMDVCRAVQHAHQKGVIHRDLKPSNIMVTLHDAKPVVKVIDFGIAKATDQKLTEKTLFTNFGQMIGTPAYMSPEQAVISGLDVDTRSDVYSLGVLLYELLTGSPPFTPQTLRSAGFDEMRRIIREEPPQKPSTKLSTMAADAKLAVAAQRQASPQALSRQLLGDLDWIVLKAIEKDRGRRYESASAFAQDIERHLNSDPVTAGAPGAGYRLRKFVHRNKGPMSAAAAIVVLLLAGTAVSTWQAIRATRARVEAVAAADAERRARDAESAQRLQAQASERKAVDAAASAEAANLQAQKRLKQIKKANDILGSIFQNLDPNEIAKNERPLQAILVEKLDKAVEQLEGESIGDPLVVAEIQQQFGRSLIGLGEATKAITLLEKAHATSESMLGPDHPNTLRSMNFLALAYSTGGEPKRAVPLLEEALKRHKRNGAAPDLDTLMYMSNLSQLYIEAGNHDRGLPLMEETYKVTRQVLGPDDVGTISAANNLAVAYLRDGKPQEYLPLLEEALELSKAKFGLNHPSTLICMDNLAGMYLGVGKNDLGVALYKECLDREKVTLGPDHIGTITTMNNLAGAYRDAGQPERALPLNLEALKLTKGKVGDDNSHTVSCMDSLARTYLALGKVDLGEPLLAEALKRERVVYGADDSSTLSCMDTLANFYVEAGKADVAIQLLLEALNGRKARLGQDNPTTLGTMNGLAGAYKSAGKLDLAVSLYEETLAMWKTTLGPDHRNTLTTMNDLAGAYRAQKRLDKSIPMYEDALKRLKRTVGPNDLDTLADMGALGVNYKEAGRVAEGIPLLEESYRARKKFPTLRRFGSYLLEAYILLGKNDEAAGLAKELLADYRTEFPSGGPKLAWHLAVVGRSMLRTKAYAEAEPAMRECLAIREKSEPDEWTTFNTQSMLGEALLGQKKYAEAEPLLLAGYEGMKERESKIPPEVRSHLAQAIERLVNLYDGRGGDGDKEKAAKYRKLLAEAPADSKPTAK